MWFGEMSHGYRFPKHLVLTNNDDSIQNKKIRFRTLGDITITGGIESDADTLEKIIARSSCIKTDRDEEIGVMTSEVILLWRIENVKVTFNFYYNNYANR